jgi:hypothetical protein
MLLLFDFHRALRVSAVQSQSPASQESLKTFKIKGLPLSLYRGCREVEALGEV